MGKERLLQPEEYIKVQQKVSPKTLCEKFGVSISTLRRDINTLEQMGCVQKAYGCILYNYSYAKDNDTIFIDRGGFPRPRWGV